MKIKIKKKEKKNTKTAHPIIANTTMRMVLDWLICLSVLVINYHFHKIHGLCFDSFDNFLFLPIVLKNRFWLKAPIKTPNRRDGDRKKVETEMIAKWQRRREWRERKKKKIQQKKQMEWGWQKMFYDEQKMNTHTHTSWDTECARTYIQL